MVANLVGPTPAAVGCRLSLVRSSSVRARGFGERTCLQALLSNGNDIPALMISLDGLSRPVITPSNTMTYTQAYRHPT